MVMQFLFQLYLRDTIQRRNTYLDKLILITKFIKIAVIKNDKSLIWNLFIENVTALC